MSIQGRVYVQNLMENETIKSDFEFAHIRHTYGTYFEIWAKFPRLWPNFQRFRFSLLSGARAPLWSKWPPTASESDYMRKIYIRSYLMDIWLQNDIAPDFGSFGHYCTEIPKCSPARDIFGCRNFYDIAEISGYPYPHQNSKHISHSSFFRIWSGFGPMGPPPPPR